jgi:hypothetical protein
MHLGVGVTLETVQISPESKVVGGETVLLSGTFCGVMADSYLPCSFMYKHQWHSLTRANIGWRTSSDTGYPAHAAPREPLHRGAHLRGRRRAVPRPRGRRKLGVPGRGRRDRDLLLQSASGGERLPTRAALPLHSQVRDSRGTRRREVLAWHTMERTVAERLVCVQSNNFETIP